MAWHSTTDTWSGGDEHTAVMRVPRAARRTRSLPPWALAALAFICGALVSAAVFTIGWRHQTQQNTAAQSALAAARARNHKLTASLASARAAVAREESLASQARASLQAARSTSATIAAQASATESAATSLTGNATAMASAAAKIATELNALTAYLTNTSPQQLDAGYIDSQTAYLARQVEALRSAGGTMGSAAASFDAAIGKLSRLASALSRQK